jgi:hypothetical protein
MRTPIKKLDEAIADQGAKPDGAGRNPPGVPLKKEALEARREKVASLFVRGFSVRQIATALRVPRSTIGEDVAKHVKPILREVLDRQAEDIYAEAAAENREIKRELWLTYSKAGEEELGLKVSILAILSNLPEKVTRLGQSLGLVVGRPIVTGEIDPEIKAAMDRLLGP